MKKIIVFSILFLNLFHINTTFSYGEYWAIDIDLLSDVFEFFWHISEDENLRLANEFLKEYNSVDLSNIEDNPDFQEVWDFLRNSILK